MLQAAAQLHKKQQVFQPDPEMDAIPLNQTFTEKLAEFTKPVEQFSLLRSSAGQPFAKPLDAPQKLLAVTSSTLHPARSLSSIIS